MSQNAKINSINIITVMLILLVIMSAALCVMMIVIPKLKEQQIETVDKGVIELNNAMIDDNSIDYWFKFNEDGTIELGDYNKTEENVTIPSEIEGYVVTKVTYNNNDKIVTMNIPDTVEKISNIRMLTNLQAINVDSNNNNYSSIDGVLCNKNANELIYYPRQKKAIFIRYLTV